MNKILIVSTAAFLFFTTTVMAESKLMQLLSGAEFEPLVNEQGLFSANMGVTGAARGSAAVKFAQDYANGDQNFIDQYTVRFNDARVQAEQELKEQNFDLTDMGVAFAYAKVSLWQLGAGKLLSRSAVSNALQFEINVFDAIKEQMPMDNNQRDIFHDLMMTYAVVYPYMVTLLTDNNSLESAQTVKKIATDEYLKLFQLPHAVAGYDSEGKYSLNEEKFIEWQKQVNTGSSQPSATSESDKPKLHSDW